MNFDPSNYVRAVTHEKLAPVARLMGYTVQGLRELIDQCRVTSEWSTIGVTRRRVNSSGEVVPSQRVNCRIVNPRRELNLRNEVVLRGRIQFSIGDDAFELTGDAKAARAIREQIANEVVRTVQLKRAKLNPRINSQQGQEEEEINPIPDQGGQSSQTIVVTPVAPRGLGWE